jgi:hypothetical protein
VTARASKKNIVYIADDSKSLESYRLPQALDNRKPKNISKTNPTSH